MLTTRLKIIITNLVFVSSAIIAMDDGAMPPTAVPTDDSLRPPRASSASLSAVDPFNKLMQTLNFLSASNGKIGPWRDAILTFQKSLTDAPTLESIRERILGQSLPGNRKKMVRLAIANIVDPSFPDLAITPTLSSITTSPVSSLSLPPMPVMPPLSNLAASVLPPTSFTIMLGSASRTRPPFRSERRPLPPPLDLDDNHTLASLGTVIDHSDPIAKRSIPAPVIIAHLDRFIAGQDEALRILSLLTHRFVCNKLLLESGMAAASSPPHCILTGPTGCGKSESLKQLGLFLKDIPILHVNARSLTDEGFKGQNFSEAVAAFCEEHGNPISAIVALDELDKLGSSADEESRNFGKAVQRLLLTPLDGGNVSLKGRTYNLKNWWVIGTGAFSKLKGRHDTDDERTTTARTHQDIISAGFEPEFVGRFSTIIPFKGHTIETMMNVISREGSPFKKIQNEFKLFYGVDLAIKDAALRRLAKISIDINLGVRSLTTILSAALQPFYSQAMDLMTAEGDKILTVTLKDIAPAIDQFVKDNKEPTAELPESIRHMYM
jgi:ATP-dependent Clp protease ATP-binding subunit ClpX